MNFLIISMALAAAVVGEAGLATDVITTGSGLGNLGASAILGIVSLASIYALVKLYKDKQAEMKETLILLKSTIEKNTETLQALRDHCFKDK